METIKSDKEQKADIIKALADAINKNTSNSDEVYKVIRSIQDCFSFLISQRYKFADDLHFFARCIGNDLKDKPQHITSLYDDMTDSLFEMLLLAGRSAEGLTLVNSKGMNEDINRIIDEWNN
jgi:uncharacterized protein YllA (UPF0747 family)